MIWQFCLRRITEDNVKKQHFILRGEEGQSVVGIVITWPHSGYLKIPEPILTTKL